MKAINRTFDFFNPTLSTLITIISFLFCCYYYVKSAFEVIKNNSVIINIARGEIIDEDALVRALAKNKIKGAALDVYVGEFERPPDSRLWDDNRVLITPHISAASDINTHRGNELFLKNLKRYMANETLENIIDWNRGY